MVHYLMTLRNANMSVEITLYVGLYRSELITLSLSLSLSLSLCVCSGRFTGQAGAYDNYFHAGQVYLAFTAATNILPDN